MPTRCNDVKRMNSADCRLRTSARGHVDVVSQNPSRSCWCWGRRYFTTIITIHPPPDASRECGEQGAIFIKTFPLQCSRVDETAISTHNSTMKWQEADTWTAFCTHHIIIIIHHHYTSSAHILKLLYSLQLRIPACPTWSNNDISSLQM